MRRLGEPAGGREPPLWYGLGYGHGPPIRVPWIVDWLFRHQKSAVREVKEPHNGCAFCQVQFFGATSSSVLQVCHREHQVELILL